jgi:hypothetical protein
MHFPGQGGCGFRLKDRKKATDGAANLAWGQGDTPIKKILDAVVEVSKCVQFCKNALA